MERFGEDSVGEEHLDMTHGEAAEHGSAGGGGGGGGVDPGVSASKVCRAI